ncbi:unnamed protein product [Ceratitis capitata]|uniref:Superoxide dismutase n=1 Tax=Ceratitis capitata TaxID=7213 RepID=A0A811VA64_CERCA|nr:unnamed protein product [Ceratitis capitata]
MFSLARTATNAAKTAVRGKHDLPKLPYDYAALEPIICREIMELHHQKHHQTYVNNLNAAEEQLAEAQQKKDVTKIIALAPALRFNGGGHINHSIFWHNLSPEKSQPSKELLCAVEEQFGSLDALKKELTTLTVAVQGSGWGWLGYNKKTKNCNWPPCPIKIHWRVAQVSCHFSALTCGSMPTTCNIKMCAHHTLKLSGISLTGRISPIVSLPPLSNV